MEKQMRAEREKRATILNSEAVREAAINKAEGEKQMVIKASEANRQQQINEAEGQANAIRTIAEATALGIERVATAIQSPGGRDAVQLRVAEQWIREFGNMAKVNNTMIVPANLADLSSMMASAMTVMKQTAAPAPPPSVRLRFSVFARLADRDRRRPRTDRRSPLRSVRAREAIRSFANPSNSRFDPNTNSFSSAANARKKCCPSASLR